MPNLHAVARALIVSLSQHRLLSLYVDYMAEGHHLSMQMGEGISGSLIYEVDPLSHAASVLKPNDVLLEVDGEECAPHKSCSPASSFSLFQGSSN